jgi:hypothetical protein
MSHRYHRRADEVVTAFKDIIGESACKQISDAEFRELSLLIRDAISDEVLSAAELVEKLAQQLRSETDILELGL